MRVAGRMRVCAFVICMIAFTSSSFITKSIIVSLITSGFAILIVYIIWIWVYRHHFIRVRIKFDILSIKKLMITVLPLMIASFIIGFLLNSQKYFLGFLDSNESVAVITILIIPTTFLNILCSSLFYGAEMTKTAKVYIEGHIGQMKQRVNKQLLVATGLSILYILCSLLFGIPLLSWVFNIDLFMYSKEFFVITLGGVSFVYIAVLNAALITMRLQKAILISYVVIAILSGSLLWYLVLHYGFYGAALSFLIIFFPMMVSLYGIYYISVRKSNKKLEKDSEKTLDN